MDKVTVLQHLFVEDSTNTEQKVGIKVETFHKIEKAKERMKELLGEATEKLACDKDGVYGYIDPDLNYINIENEEKTMYFEAKIAVCEVQ